MIQLITKYLIHRHSICYKTTSSNKCFQIFVSYKGFVAVYPMKSQEEFQRALHLFCKDVGVPVDLIADGHSSPKNPTVHKDCQKIGLSLNGSL